HHLADSRGGHLHPRTKGKLMISLFDGAPLVIPDSGNHFDVVVLCDGRIKIIKWTPAFKPVFTQSQALNLGAWLLQLAVPVALTVEQLSANPFQVAARKHGGVIINHWTPAAMDLLSPVLTKVQAS